MGGGNGAGEGVKEGEGEGGEGGGEQEEEPLLTTSERRPSVELYVDVDKLEVSLCTYIHVHVCTYIHVHVGVDKQSAKKAVLP